MRFDCGTCCQCDLIEIGDSEDQAELEESIRGLLHTSPSNLGVQAFTFIRGKCEADIKYLNYYYIYRNTSSYQRHSNSSSPSSKMTYPKPEPYKKEEELEILRLRLDENLSWSNILTEFNSKFQATRPQDGLKKKYYKTLTDAGIPHSKNIDRVHLNSRIAAYLDCFILFAFPDVREESLWFDVREGATSFFIFLLSGLGLNQAVCIGRTNLLDFLIIYRPIFHIRLLVLAPTVSISTRCYLIYHKYDMMRTENCSSFN